MLFASGLLALLPSIAKNVSSSPAGYGALLGCFGLGAVFGAHDPAEFQNAQFHTAASVAERGALLAGKGGDALHDACQHTHPIAQ